MVATVTRSWKVYGADGHRQRESFYDSYKCDFSKDGNMRIIEVENSDITKLKKFFKKGGVFIMRKKEDFQNQQDYNKYVLDKFYKIFGNGTNLSDMQVEALKVLSFAISNIFTINENVKVFNSLQEENKLN